MIKNITVQQAGSLSYKTMTFDYKIGDKVKFKDALGSRVGILTLLKGKVLKVTPKFLVVDTGTRFPWRISKTRVRPMDYPYYFE